jgi:hypothetical protein
MTAGACVQKPLPTTMYSPMLALLDFLSAATSKEVRALLTRAELLS